MKARAAIGTDEEPVEPLGYLLLRTALALFGKGPAELAAPDREEAERQARRQLLIESRVLASAEAAGVVPGAEAVAAGVATIAGRYADREEFLADLARNGLTEEALAAALERELRVEAVLERVGARCPPVSEQDVAIVFYQHPERFQRPETRTVSHILITVNEAYPENRREAVLERCRALARQLEEGAEFATLAQRYSECPSALQGGRLGTLPRGKLFPQLDEVLFELAAGELSEPVESELGFHLLWCEEVQPAGPVALERVAPRIRQSLEKRARERHARAWLAQLVGSSP